MMFNSFYFIYKSAKLTSDSIFSIYPTEDTRILDYFFLYWIGVIGVWTLQPKIKTALEYPEDGRDPNQIF